MPRPFFTAPQLREHNAAVAGAGPARILEAAARAFHPDLAFACSLGLEDMVLLDLMAALEIRPRVFFLDTGRLHQETYDTLAAARQRYGPIQVLFPQAAAVEALVAAKGPNSFYDSLEDRKECCRIRKVEPLGRALAGASAWITGLRRDQAATRGELAVFEADAANGGLTKISPLLDWTLEQTWAYLREHKVPHNPLHDLGFPSIGCAPCTRAVAPGEDLRAGRWWWENPEHKECGLHARPPLEAKR